MTKVINTPNYTRIDLPEGRSSVFFNLPLNLVIENINLEDSDRVNEQLMKFENVTFYYESLIIGKGSELECIDVHHIYGDDGSSYISLEFTPSMKLPLEKSLYLIHKLKNLSTLSEIKSTPDDIYVTDNQVVIETIDNIYLLEYDKKRNVATINGTRLGLVKSKEDFTRLINLLYEVTKDI